MYEQNIRDPHTSPTVLMMPINFFHYKQFESVNMLQIEIDTMDFTDLYALYRWNFLSSLLKNVFSHFSKKDYVKMGG